MGRFMLPVRHWPKIIQVGLELLLWEIVDTRWWYPAVSSSPSPTITVVFATEGRTKSDEEWRGRLAVASCPSNVISCHLAWTTQESRDGESHPGGFLMADLGWAPTPAWSGSRSLVTWENPLISSRRQAVRQPNIVTSIL